MKDRATPKRNHTLTFRRLKNLLMHEEDLKSGCTLENVFGQKIGRRAQQFLDHHRNLANESN